ncbi:hypothetical protein PHLGIDRAFT_110785 [Phlebiopsis gigantea 11061_1 CR5-6]|uniref:CHCH domain-containing protein n=1 Tax=Phlebiopsis gigantea (strain 11061_1 CR5-6) TaxID=745531 RepID=A0A0C3NFM1_PHLG1|nr:hypothetical protein PHLGIDRAFT_110785 [Phlebiopsis gigantea 11061_1 CR5-6]
MSFGRPPSISTGFSPAPPDRGSFPLDHYGECKEYMSVYLDCLRKNSSNSTPCRPLNRNYLDCRMNKGLMDRDDWKNLGLSNLAGDTPKSGPPTSTSNPPSSQTDPSKPS